MVLSTLNSPIGWYQPTSYYKASIPTTGIIDKLKLVKDNSGNAYFPEWNFASQTMANLTPGQGYQMLTLDVLSNVQFPADINLGIPFIDQ